MDILFVDDEPQGREAISEHLENLLGHSIIQCDSGNRAFELYGRRDFPMVLTDIRMPGMDGIELLRKIKESPKGDNTDVVLITAHGDMTTVLAALRTGAYDYLSKPIEIDELVAIVDRVEEHQALLRENMVLTSRFEEKVEEVTRESKEMLCGLRLADISDIGEIGVFSESMREVFELAKRYGEDHSIPVLIEGETGTGKEIIARVIHYGNAGGSSPFVAINCPAISPSLCESELFGYEQGAFTGARKTGQLGKLEYAREGTVFLDEIGDLPIEMQPKLLRVLQEKVYYRVGGLRKIDFKAKVICATNQDLEQLVGKGLFREDLYYRLNIGKIFIPPLRDRREEIIPLTRMFLRKFSLRRKRAFREIATETEKLLTGYHWPGNVRELKNMIERAVLLYDDEELKPGHLAFPSQQNHKAAGLSSGDSLVIALPEKNMNVDQVEAMFIGKVLSMFDNNKSRTAAYLGISPASLRRKMKRLSMSDND